MTTTESSPAATSAVPSLPQPEHQQQ